MYGDVIEYYVETKKVQGTVVCENPHVIRSTYYNTYLIVPTENYNVIYHDANTVKPKGNVIERIKNYMEKNNIVQNTKNEVSGGSNSESGSNHTNH